MRLGILAADDLPPGGRARRVARALAAAGHQVTVHGVLAEGAEPEEDDGPVVLVRAHLDRWRRARGGLRGMLAAAGAFSRFEPLARLAVARGPTEAIHVLGLDAADAALAAAKAARLPLVFEDTAGGAGAAGGEAETGSAGPPGTRLERDLSLLRARGAAVERRVRRAAAAAIATSDALADEAQERFGGERPVVVRDCPLLRRVGPSDLLRVRLGIHPADRIVVFHGPPDRAHGVETAIRALRVLGDRVVLAILGATWCQDRLLRVAAEAGVLAQVRVLAPGPEDDVVRLVASAEAAVLPLSPSDRVARLGLPSALLECLLAGTPVVVTDVPESGALVRRIAAGIVVPAPRGEPSEPHPNDVAEGVRALLSDARLRAACGANAARAVREDLHWERESRRLADLYERLAAQG